MNGLLEKSILMERDIVLLLNSLYLRVFQVKFNVAY